MAKCECPEEGVLSVEWVDTYDPVTELPFVAHDPGECRCTNGLKRYVRDGKVLWLCSCCFMTGDELYKEGMVNGN